MASVKSLVLLLSLGTRLNAFSVDRNSKSCVWQTAVRPPSLTNDISPCLARLPTSCTSEGKWRNAPRSSLQLSSSPSEDDDDSPWYSNVSIPYATALAVFVGFAAFLAPGDFGSPSDNAMIQAYIDNPLSPGLNPIFNAVFNLLGTTPLVLSCLVYPQASPRGLTPAPFLAASAAMGYGGLGPYMVFRKKPREQVTQSELGDLIADVLENKLFNWAVAALCAYQYYIVAVPILDHPSQVWEGFAELLTTSKFASVSTLDLCILSATAASLIPLDYSYRHDPSSSAIAQARQEGNVIAVSTLLLPLLGASLYCALRPKLPKD